MKENLDYGGTVADHIPQTDNCTPEKYGHSSSGTPYSFYQWDELMAYSPVAGSQGLCPPGWHVPAPDEWSTLASLLNGPGLAGGTLRDPVLAGGFRSEQPGFLYLNNLWSFTTGGSAGAMYWTSAPAGADRAVARGLNDFTLSLSLYTAARANAFSARCVKD